MSLPVFRNKFPLANAVIQSCFSARVALACRTTMPSQNDPHSTVGNKFVTGEAAESIFSEWALQENGIPRKQSPDFFVDYLVEIVRNGEPSGRLFAAQIKGVSIGKNSIAPRKLTLKGKHVRYWLKDCQHPVFVFLIDVQSRTGFWLFIQKAAKEHISLAALERQKSFTFHVSPDDNLDNRENFRTTLIEAEKYVRDLHPGSVQAALAKRRAELEAKEPRFDYKIVAIENAQTIRISPKAPVSLKLEFDNAHSNEMLKAYLLAMETGAKLEIPLSKAKITGSPLFEELSRTNGSLVMQFGQEAPGQLILSRANAANRKMLVIDGTYVIGTKVANFKSTNADLPLDIECKLGPAPEPENMDMELLIKSGLGRWQGLPLLQLPYFEPLLEVLGAIADGTGIQTESVVRGVPLAGDLRRDLNHPDMMRLFNFVAWVGRCQMIARHFGVNPTLPKFDTITDEQWEIVEDVAALIAGHKRMVPMPNLSARCTLNGDPENFIQTGIHGCLRFVNENPDFGLFGIRLKSSPINLTFTNVKVSPVSSEKVGCQVLEIEGTASTHKLIEEFTR